MSGYEYQYLSHEYREILQSDWAALLSAAVQILYKRVSRPPIRDGRATPNYIAAIANSSIY